MPTLTYTPLATLTLSASAASVTFSSISQAYRDLVLVVQLKSSAVANVYVRPNSDATTANYSQVYMGGSGTAAYSASATSNPGFMLTGLSNPDATNLWNAKLDLMDYSATDKHKTALVRADDASEGTLAQASRWASTAAVTSLVITTNTATTWSAGSTFSLYGIAA